MIVLPIVVATFLIYAIAYVYYGRRILGERVTRISAEASTPAVSKFDGVDYVPANRYVLFGHHFASIAGAGPIVGPAIAMAYGWFLPLVWVLFGNVFLGAVHDYLSLMASVRYGGISVVSISENLMGRSARYLFLVYVVFTLILVYSAFASVAARLFAGDPRIATLALLYMPIALFMGILMYRLGVDVRIATVVTLVLVGAAFIYSYNVGLLVGPFDGKEVWTAYRIWVLLLGVYAIIAASLPVWYLLQPRDYTNAYLLWISLGAAIVGVLLLGDWSLRGPAYTSFAPNIIGGQPTPFWPAIPLIIACGSLSGFHSLVASGTTSKQLASELDAIFVGYGGMLTEGTLSLMAVILPISLAWNAPELVEIGVLEEGETLLDKGAVPRYTIGYGYVLGAAVSRLGIASFEAGYNFFSLLAALVLAMYVMTTLDTSTRLARFAWQELMVLVEPISRGLYAVATNRWVASFIIVLVGTAMAYPVIDIGGRLLPAYNVIWPAFAGANQMLAAIALMTTSLWVYVVLKVRGGISALIVLPAIFLWVTVTAALIWWLLFVAVLPMLRGEPVLAPIQLLGAGSMILFSLVLSLLLAALYAKSLMKAISTARSR